MSVFAVHVSSDPPAPVARRIEEKYPGTGHHKVSERFYLVRADTLAHTLAEDLGIRGKGPSEFSGVVFRLNAAYAGFDDPAIWEWLSLAELSAR